MDEPEIKELIRKMDKELHENCYLRGKKEDDVDRYVKSLVYIVLRERDYTEKEIDSIANVVAPIIDLAVMAKMQDTTRMVERHGTYIKIIWGLVGLALSAGVGAAVTLILRAV